MGIEIEKKYRLSPEQRDRVLKRLKEIDAEFLEEVFEENTLYAGGSIDSKNSVLRLRRVRDFATLTYKKQVLSNDAIKHRREDETRVDDPDATAAILEALGFLPAIIYEKRRATWRAAETEIVIDELPFGLFMEIEGEEKAILKSEELLGIEDLAPEHSSYPGLAAKLGTKKGEIIEARF